MKLQTSMASIFASVCRTQEVIVPWLTFGSNWNYLWENLSETRSKPVPGLPWPYPESDPLPEVILY